MALYPYLNFGGNCREAFTRYHEILGGELEIMMMEDMPDSEEVPAEMAGLVAHAALRLGDSLLMASDDPTGSFGGISGAYVNYTLTDAAEAKRVFDALAEDGEIEMPIGETFWSPMFGICTDRFGAGWMVNVDPEG